MGYILSIGTRSGIMNCFDCFICGDELSTFHWRLAFERLCERSDERVVCCRRFGVHVERNVQDSDCPTGVGDALFEEHHAIFSTVRSLGAIGTTAFARRSFLVRHVKGECQREARFLTRVRTHTFFSAGRMRMAANGWKASVSRYASSVHRSSTNVQPEQQMLVNN